MNQMENSEDDTIKEDEAPATEESNTVEDEQVEQETKPEVKQNVSSAGASRVDSPISDTDELDEEKSFDVSKTSENTDDKKTGKKTSEAHEEGEASDEGEVDDPGVEKEDPEEGELEDGEVDEDEDGDKNSKSGQICKYFYKGQCTWGSHCRFIHPGSVDKGNYDMFDGSKGKKEEPAVPTSVQLQRDVKLAPPLRTAATRPPRPRTPPPVPAAPLIVPPMNLFARIIPQADFFPAVIEPPRRESAWEKSLRSAKILSQAAAKKRDAMEDKMHGLGDAFDPELENEFRQKELQPFPFNEVGRQRVPFPAFAVRNDFEAAQREARRMNFNNFGNGREMMDRMEPRRRSPPGPTDMRRNLSDRSLNDRNMNDRMNQRNRAPDEWRDPWMRSRSPINRDRRREDPSKWERPERPARKPTVKPPRSRSGSPISKTSKISATSRISDVSGPKGATQRRSGESPRRTAPPQRAPSGSPISSPSHHSPRSSPSKSPSPAPLLRRDSATFDRQKRLSNTSAITPPRNGASRKREPNSRNGRAAKKAHEGSPISSVGSRISSAEEVDTEEEGPRTPPIDDEGESTAEESQDEERPSRRRQHSGSPISPEGSPERTQSPAEQPSEEPDRKKLKKSHKPIKLTIGIKAERRNPLAAFGLMAEDDENDPDKAAADAPSRPEPTSVEDRSSPLSDEEIPQKAKAPSSQEADKAQKREELLRQLKAVEEAIARKKAAKATE
ncbi:hypothetical protein RvY_06438 [Ramazzottius varieornatus]|uniref:C3H1-type domain-containing protein n=1 Tax=Ramazzottius varieornatus TaxID=947166 RepID=A0A1D1UYK4_RAMVA|nr:hypothetical protein RvY_06438 [Ramazzottius varieornatus]